MRISGLVTAIKGFTHMDQATVAEPVDLVQGLGNTVAVLKSKARAKSVAVVVDVEPGLPRVRGFVGELNQIWANLIDNALDAVPESGRVEVLASRERQRVVVRIVDNGTGIPAADSRAHLRPVLHHQADGPGHRPGPRHRPAPRPPQRRRNLRRVATGPDGVPGRPAARRRSTATEERHEQARPPRRRRRSAGARRRAPRPPLPLPRALHGDERGIGTGGAGDRPRTEEPRGFAGHGHQRSAHARHAGERSARQVARGVPAGAARPAHGLLGHRGGRQSHQRGASRLLPVEAMGSARGTSLPGRSTISSTPGRPSICPRRRD